ncbi:sigma-70 family RNA polymerase sigma factor [Actinomadura sp. ATCC 31491]|uniref:Sigma-70 family RNA polymerase sigma factor n=1 Tax=Actinomadura luzonensis TaxID=2805427 RepID=A0ABT0FZK4_9ACTN|nr:sigma-70 family RNA polymerase sigma factor [Actinomadura luzonensis]MCK2217709.1 sigma-70 family RNA polymerase sigma factor [Actinomadura luzonensis]
MHAQRAPEELLRAAADGDRSAWDALESRFGPLMWAVARACGLGAADAADVVQGAWLRLLQHLDDIREPERVGAWLATTVRREALLVLRESRPGVHWAAEAGEPEPGAAVLGSHERQALWSTVSTLREPCRTLLQLVAIDLGSRQTAARLGLPLGSVGPTRARCLEKLRTLISPQEPAQ